MSLKLRVLAAVVLSACAVGSWAAGAAAASAPFLPPEAPKAQVPAARSAQAQALGAPGSLQVLSVVPRAEPPAPAKAGGKSALVIGDGHDIAGGGTLAFADLQWSTRADGSAVAVAQVSLPGVVGFRLSLDPRSLGGVSLRQQALAPDATVFGPIGLAQIRAQRQDSGLGDDAPYWLPVVEGDAVRIELTRPAGAEPAGTGLRFDAASVLRQLPTEDPAKQLGDIGRSGSCNINIACQYTDLATAVAKYLFTTPQGFTALCTGTLLNDTASSRTPWFVTANHCVSTAAETNSMQFYWFFWSTTCQGTNVQQPLTTTVGGAALLNTNAVQDTTLVRINQAVPNETARAGWTGTLVPLQTQVIGIHHPQGDLQKWSRGLVLDRDWWEFEASPDSHLVIGWQQGTTEQGSSGSGIFNAQNQIVGVLSGGAASCQNQQAPDWYGRFDRMVDALSPWLIADGGGGGNLQPGTMVTFTGRVANQGGQGLCAMVLINGQYMFSCGGNGEYQLTFPLDANRQATVFSFVDGLAPYRQVVTPSQLNTTVNIGMSPSTGAPGPLVTLTSVVPQADGWVALAGQVRNGQGQPLCAMVLANGQYMFSCGGQGAFNLTVPRAPDGSITLFTFVDGMSPYRSTFTP